jgi:hypothetical protein
LKVALLARLKRLETVRAVQEGSHLPKFQFAYLKLLPREYSGPRHIVKVGQRADGHECEERPGAPPTNQRRVSDDQNVMTIYFVRAQNTANEIGRATD